MRVAIAIIAVLVVGGVARAQAPPGDATIARARVLYAEGSKHYDLREYNEAIAAFRQAYDLFAEPLFLFNLGQAYRQVKDCENAASFYRTYLRKLPKADNRDKVNQFIVEMDACTPPRPAVKPTPVELRGPVVARPAPDHAVRLAGILTVVGGAVVTGAAVYFSLDAASSARQVETICKGGCDSSEISAIDRQGHDAQRTALVLYGVGGVTLATGVGLLVWSMLRADPEGLTITPTPGGATMSTMVRF